MTIKEFMNTVRERALPPEISDNLKALWFDAAGDWHKAHEIVQETSGFEGDWIHAYLHRQEGDLGNAFYWYSRVGKSRPSTSLEEEWKELANYLLNT